MAQVARESFEHRLMQANESYAREWRARERLETAILDALKFLNRENRTEADVNAARDVLWKNAKENFPEFRERVRRLP